MKEGLPFAPDLSLENSADSYLRFWLVLLHSLFSFFSIDLPSANVFVFGDFNIHHKDWLTYFGGIDRPGELYYNFFL